MPVSTRYNDGGAISLVCAESRNDPAHKIDTRKRRGQRRITVYTMRRRPESYTQSTHRPLRFCAFRYINGNENEMQTVENRQTTKRIKQQMTVRINKQSRAKRCNVKCKRMHRAKCNHVEVQQRTVLSKPSNGKEEEVAGSTTIFPLCRKFLVSS